MRWSGHNSVIHRMCFENRTCLQHLARVHRVGYHRAFLPSLLSDSSEVCGDAQAHLIQPSVWRVLRFEINEYSAAPAHFLRTDYYEPEPFRGRSNTMLQLASVPPDKDL